MAKYSVLEASKILNISKQAVIHRIKKDLLKGFKDESGQWVVEIDNSEGSNSDQKVSNDDPKVSNEGPNTGQMGSNDHQMGSNDDKDHQERRPRRENDDALLKNNEFLQLSTAANQQVVSDLKDHIRELTKDLKSSSDSKSRVYVINFVALISLTALMVVYFNNQTDQVKEESKSLRDEMKLDHQTAIKSYESTIKSLDTKHQDTIKSMDEKYQTRYQKVSNDYQMRYQEASNDYQKKESLLQDQIELLKSQNKELIELLKASKSGNLK